MFPEVLLRKVRDAAEVDHEIDPVVQDLGRGVQDLDREIGGVVQEIDLVIEILEKNPVIKKGTKREKKNGNGKEKKNAKGAKRVYHQ